MATDSGSASDGQSCLAADRVRQMKRFCAVIDVKTESVADFCRKYNDKFWINFDKDCDFGFKCFVKRIKVVDTGDEDNHRTDPLRKAIETNAAFGRHRSRHLTDRLKQRSPEVSLDSLSTALDGDGSGGDLVLTLSEVKSLRELNPPFDIMPNGNVGTPSTVFLELIRECKLPAPVISKLELDFPKSMKRRIYSRVEFTYNDRNKRLFKPKSSDKSVEQLVSNHNPNDDKDMDLIKTRTGFVINDKFSSTQRTSESNAKQTDGKDKDREEEDGSDEDEEEEWDRYESLHDDVTQQERNSERLFEEEIELKWEKGGSGLVFYTDAQFWDMKDNYEDFNEKTPDDWDLDLSVYRNNASADKEAIDLKTLTDEMKLRLGKRKQKKYSVDSVFDKRKRGESIGAFERHTKGFGRRIMESQGWKSGTGLGQSVSGIPEPIDDCGQMPTDKRGFGYRGERLKSYQYLKPYDKNESKY
ncbi:unnamed protein product [Medioppia subpectinata]|uniref:G-patch domain-containing protein n=1 Tax=Medioppia subpectinata TaxID=1979941 RepID=A0A7R9Q224_9ACAR|nr:unnamed protein product [Medioppia subpectinata]CAG2109051.1 unnamed protein product [Medioppia subpectinata]